MATNILKHTWLHVRFKNCHLIHWFLFPFRGGNNRHTIRNLVPIITSGHEVGTSRNKSTGNFWERRGGYERDPSVFCVYVMSLRFEYIFLFERATISLSEMPRSNLYGPCTLGKRIPIEFHPVLSLYNCTNEQSLEFCVVIFLSLL